MKKFFADFKAFISRGNVLDMAVGVIIGGAFGAIVTALVNILLSLCTWGVPGGIKGLVTVLYAANDAQAGMALGLNPADLTQKFQTFTTDQFNEAATFIGTQANANDPVLYGANILNAKYTLHGTTYTYNMSAVIDWGTFINAIISFLIIAFTLFIIVKIAVASAKKRADIKAKIEAEKYKKWAEAHPEEAAELERKKAEEEAEAERLKNYKPATTDDVVKLLAEISEKLEKKAE